MLAISGAVLCLAYVLGLLLTGLPGTIQGIPVGAIVLLGVGVGCSLLLPRFWKTGVRSRVWLIAGLIGFAATLYFQWRLPHPGTTDISRLLSGENSAVPVQVTGKIITSPRLTQSQRIQFELQVAQAKVQSGSATPEVPALGGVSSPVSGQGSGQISGQIYVTVPLLQGTGLYPGQKVHLTGSLYRPKPAANPGGFDFEKYLAQQGIFAGLSGKTVEIPDRPSPPLLWSIRQRIIRAQVTGAGVPEGTLISAMVMGGKTVDVSPAVRDAFKTVGLAHALAASGAQVSLLVGVVLALTQRCPGRWRLAIGSGILLLYMGLTGLEASVLRATVMGGVALFALAADRKVKPLGSILFAAVLLLLWNPLWIWDLGFQLSFLATLGLVVTVPVLNQGLDWLPSAITPLFSVPIAAYLWTLPLQLLVFGVVSPYSILINIASSPLITGISIGGMVSALAAWVYFPLGSATAWLLAYPTKALIALATWGSRLPGSSFAVGTIAIWQVLLLYGLVLLVWVWHRSHRYWWAAGMVAIGLVAVPVWYNASHLLQVTVLTTSGDPVLVLQDRGKVGLIGSPTEKDTQFTVLPFLRQQGINQIDWAIAPDLNAALESWQRIGSTVAVQTLYQPTQANQTNQTQTHQTEPSALALGKTHLSLLPQQPISLASATVQLVSFSPSMLQLSLNHQNWLLLGNLPPAEQQTATLAQQLPASQILLWSGQALSSPWLEALQPQVAIAASRSLSPTTNQWLQAHAVTQFLTAQDGAVQWREERGFQTMRQVDGAAE